MSATIQLRKGDMFAQPTDLIIIPCSTAATITKQVANKLRSFEIHPPRKLMNLGDVEFRLFEGAASIASYVGYAASVAAMQTNVRAIKRIAQRVAAFANEKSEIRNITFPLLGSGAGGLSSQQSAEALIEGLVKESSASKVFNIFVFDSDEFRSLRSELKSNKIISPSRQSSDQLDQQPALGSHAEKSREAIRVFISYTRTSIEHHEWVKDLAAFLRNNGIDARLDIWHLRRGMDIPQWMSNEIDMADRILVICNENYAERADGRLGGVGWEIRLIQGDLLSSQAENPKKYLPILKGAFHPKSIPAFLRGTYHIAWSDGRESEPREQLLRELYEVYEEAPPLGSPPRFVIR